MFKSEVKCVVCNAHFLKETRRINESLKCGWAFFCSSRCLSISRSNSVIIECFYCKRKFKRIKSQLVGLHSFCSLSCAAKTNNILFPKRMTTPKICLVCEREFKSKKKYCSAKCHAKGQTIPANQLLKEIQFFYNKVGRIPMKREVKHYHAIRGRFGTLNNAISKAGFEPRVEKFSKKYKAKDGHICDSLSEKIIDDWLFAKKIVHQRKMLYPGGQGFSADFFINDYWIEFFGLAGQLERYDQLRRRKLRLVKRYKLKFISLYPKDLYPKFCLERKLNFLLN